MTFPLIYQLSLNFYEYLCKQWEDAHAIVAKGVDEPWSILLIKHICPQEHHESISFLLFRKGKGDSREDLWPDLFQIQKKNPLPVLLRYDAMLNASFPQVKCFNFLWKLNYSMVNLSIKTCFVCICPILLFNYLYIICLTKP